MTWSSFFKSRSFTYGSRAAATGLVLGTAGTVVIALNIASKCSSVVDLCVAEVDKNINIPEVEAVVEIRNHSMPITVYDINAPFPAALSDVVKQLNELPIYCFYAPMFIGLCITFAISLSLASAIAVAIHIKDQDENSSTSISYEALSSV